MGRKLLLFHANKVTKNWEYFGLFFTIDDRSIQFCDQILKSVCNLESSFKEIAPITFIRGPAIPLLPFYW